MQTLITAHSGADGTPDNSLDFVRYALSAGADALELDVRRNPDGELVLGHDSAGAVALPAALKLAASRPGVRVNCDLKEPGLEEAVCVAAEAQGLGGRLILTGTVDAAFWGRRPELAAVGEVWINLEAVVPRLYLSYREIPDFELEAARMVLSVCRENRITTVNMNQRLVTRRFLETLREAGVGLSAWTVNEPAEIQWFLQRGAANITTRNAAAALSLRREQGGSPPSAIL